MLALYIVLKTNLDLAIIQGLEVRVSKLAVSRMFLNVPAYSRCSYDIAIYNSYLAINYTVFGFLSMVL